ncbi:MAG: AMP-binding protein [Rickettsiella sp.]|nr:AMP-binding protein [Rickettsiella sp.]
MKKIWLDRYQQQVPAEINPDIYPSLNALFIDSCKKFKNLSALNFFNISISFQKLAKLSENFAAYLQIDCGLKKGKRVAVMLPNCPQYMVAVFGALQAGLVVINVNPFYTTPELIQQIKHSQAEVIVVLSSFLTSLEDGLSQTQIKYVISTDLGDLLPWPRSRLISWMAQRFIKKARNDVTGFSDIKFPKSLKRGSRLRLLPLCVQREDVAFLQYTGGTTGKPKAAMLTHRNMLANIEQLTAWVRPILQEGSETMITALPLYHIFSLMVNGLMGLRLGANNVLIPDARNIKQLIRVLGKHRFSVLLGVNTLFKALLNQSAFLQLDFSSLKIALGGGAPLQTIVKEKWKQATGKLLLEGYGLTEASPVVCAPPWDLIVTGNHVGLPLPSTTIRLQDEQGNEVALGKVGELCVKGPQVMKAYWAQDATETAIAFDKAGWLLTGDLARLDQQGFVFIVGRKKDLILVSGFNVYPIEIEAIIQKHPKVSEAVVIGVPSENTGEAIKAFVVRRDTTLTEKELLNYCRQYLTAYKLPSEIVFLAYLPKSYLGKILKKKLK